jgi:hypothetical protein
MKKITLLITMAVLFSLFTVQHVIGQQKVVEMGSVVAQDATATPEAEPEATEEDAEEVSEIMDVHVEIPFLSAWMSSPHANRESGSFTRWDNADPQVVPTTCAKCHSTSGMLDYLGADGSDPLVVNEAAPIGSVVECMACHNEVSRNLDSVVMPSGMVVGNLGPEATCMECHQGRASTVSVLAAIERLDLDDEDAVNEELTFINIHYYAAAASKYGTWAKGGFEYEDQSYDAFFMHVTEFSSCQECHNPHTLELELEACATCHVGVETAEDLKDIRMLGSMMDYNGDGDVTQGIYYEIAGLKDILYANIQAYAAEVTGTPIGYNSDSHPYFFIDLNEDGVIDAEEAVRANMYKSWTPRLLKAAYNFQTAKKDPGNYAHGPKYHIQLLHDSIMDLNEALPEVADLSMLVRNDSGHFDGSDATWRYWDARDATVPGSCAKCHTSDGLPFFLAEGVNVSTPSANGMQCSTCHSDLVTFDRYEVESVVFPSGVTLASTNPDDNLCMNCHMGRESGVDVAFAVAGLEEDTVADRLSFINPHFFAAAATRYGAEAIGAYQYEDKDYFGYFEHVRRYNDCTECHDAHQLVVDWVACADCHDGISGPEDLVNIREWEDDFDGDGDTTEGIAGEIATMHAILYDAIQIYAAETIGVPIVYDPYTYPYFFIDSDGDGEVSPGEAIFPNRYATWTPRLLQAAYNFQYVQKDPGAYAHNGLYIIQVLYDSLEDIGVDVSDMVRPE